MHELSGGGDGYSDKHVTPRAREPKCLFDQEAQLRINLKKGDFPGGAVDKTLCSQCRGPGSIPGRGTRSHMHAATKSSHATTKEPTSCN